MEQNYRLTIAYDGSRFFGWERQPDKDTIQGKLEAVLGTLQGYPVNVIGAGRTDAGVHARAMTANVVLDVTETPDALRDYLNRYLPDAIAVREVKEAAPRFHARYNALGKTYRYTCHTGPVKPVFDARAIAPILIMFIVTAVETVGDISGVIEGGMNREATDKELSGGVICDGIGSSFAALFGILPNTSFSQNVGLVTMTKVVNRTALATGAVFLILCGLVPKLGAIVSIMPQAVLGGAAVMMFSSIVISGIQLVTKEKMTAKNLTIVSVALGVGYGMGANTAILAQTPQAIQLIFGGSGIVPAAMVAILLNIVLPNDKK